MCCKFLYNLDPSDSGCHVIFMMPPNTHSKKKFIYLWICWVCVAALVLSLAAVNGGGATLHCGAQASHCGGFFCCRAGVPGTRASAVAACSLRGCGVQAPGCMGIGSCDTGAQ